jgi:hypothetical protein
MDKIGPEIVRSEVLELQATIEAQLTDGFLNDVARAKVETLPDDISAAEIADIILPRPPTGEILAPRWTLIEKADALKAVSVVNTQNKEQIYETSRSLGLRFVAYGARQPERYETIDADRAVFVVEGGANKTSITRRGVAIKAMHEKYGDDLSSKTLYQLGTGRKITPTRTLKQPDGSSKEGPNAEFNTIRTLADEYLPVGEFTEFEASLATAQADGYVIAEKVNVDGDDTTEKKYVLSHSSDKYAPRLVLIQPSGVELMDGFTALKPIINGNQLVMATNGQYREKDKYQAEIWALENKIDMLPTVALGDEPGDMFPYLDGQIEVPNRPETAYINDLIILWRLAAWRLTAMANAS